MLAKAEEAAKAYNASARAVAKRMGVSPRLVTAEKIMRQSETMRPS
jgi:hypothetical protein